MLTERQKGRISVTVGISGRSAPGGRDVFNGYPSSIAVRRATIYVAVHLPVSQRLGACGKPGNVQGKQRKANRQDFPKL